MNLLIDIGNSRIKWGYGNGMQIINPGSVERGQTLPAEVISIWQASPKPVRILAANVAGDDYARALSTWCQQQWGVEVELAAVEASAFGVEIAYQQPQHLGVDRWLAMIAAHHLVQGTLCVVDCGTAVTIDVISADGQHQGGVILPGLVMMQSCLIENTEGVQRSMTATLAEKNLAILGRDTRSGVEKGAVAAIEGAIEYILGKMKIELHPSTLCVISGGDAETVMAGLNSQCSHVPDLVLRGLQLTAGDHRQ